jgi:hypothetical protein
MEASLIAVDGAEFECHGDHFVCAGVDPLAKQLFIRAIVFDAETGDSRPVKEVQEFLACGFNVKSILVPRNVQVLRSGCFSHCRALLSIAFETHSRLERIESSAFSNCALESITILRGVPWSGCSEGINGEIEYVNEDEVICMRKC